MRHEDTHLKASILQVLPALTMGGVERGTLEIGRALVAAGYRSTVVSNGGPMVTQLLAEGSEHVALPVHRKSPLSLRLVTPLRELISHYDLVHVRSRLPAWLIYLAWRKLPQHSRPRLVTTVHGRYSVNRYSEIMTKGERVIAISKNVREYILENYPKVEADRIDLIHRGVDPSEFPRNYQPSNEWLTEWQQDHPHLEDKELLALPGRISRWKGHESFIRLIARLRTDDQVHGLIVGGAERKQQRFLEELQQKCRGLGLEDRVTFLGPRSDMREIMSQCAAIYNLSTHPEPFGRTMIEALSLGRPVIAWNYGGAAESVGELFPDGLVAVGDEQALAETTLQLLRKQLPQPLPNTFVLERMQRQTLNVYAQLLDAD
ncbi:MAG: glycosyltransferase family 4 protein [Pseudomonadota bacterium]|nr:glycosyltransferase family 4 protein [Pseudomonadota bacterium]